MKRLLALLAATAVTGSANAALLNVPEDYSTIAAAIGAALDGDVVQINDDGVYTESLLVDKPIVLRAAVGSNPELRAPAGEAHALRIRPGADGARVGDAGYGIISVRGAADVSSLVHVGGGAIGNVEIEHLSLLATTSTTTGIHFASSVDAVVRDVVYDGDNTGNLGIRFEEIGGGSVHLERVTIVNSTDRGLYFDAGSAGGDVTLLACHIDVEKRAILVDPGAGPFNLDVDTCWIENRDATQAWDLLSFRAPNWDIRVSQCALNNRGTGSTVYLFPANGSDLLVQQTDVLAASVGIRIFEGENRTVMIRDNNIVGPNAFLTTLDGSDSLTTTYNNATGNRNGVPLGTGDRSSPITPSYTNTSIGKFLYAQSSLRTGSSTGGPLGCYLDFSDAPFSASADDTYKTNFANTWTGPSPVPADMDEYNTRIKFDRFLGNSLNQRLAEVEIGIYSPMVGLDIWGEALNTMAKATGDVKYIQENLKLIRRVLAVRDDRRDPPYELWDGRVVPTWSSSTYSPRGREYYSLHTGSIIYHMFQFLVLVDENPEFMAELDEGEYVYIRDSITEALDLHNDEWFDGPAPGEGHYRTRVDYEDPAYSNIPVPLNWMGAIGRALWMSWIATGNEDHRDKAIKMATFVKNRMHLTPDGGYVWEYWPIGDPVVGSISRNVLASEDTNHGVFTMMFPALMAKHDVVFDRGDALRFAKTIENGISRLDGGYALSDISGEPNRFAPSLTSATSIALHFAEFSPSVYPLVSDFYRLWRASPGTIDGAFLVYYHHREVGLRNSGTPPEDSGVPSDLWMIQ